MRKKYSKKIKINFFNLFILASAIIAGLTLIHDFFILAIIPLFASKFYCLTYFGMFVDLAAIFVLEASMQYIGEWFK